MAKILRAAAATFAALAPMLSGCGRDSEAGNESQADSAVSNAQTTAAPKYTDRLRTLPDAEQKTELARAARQANEECSEIRRITPAGRDEAVPVWTVSCSDGGELALVLSDSGVARILRTKSPTPPPSPEPNFDMTGRYFATTNRFLGHTIPSEIRFTGPGFCRVITGGANLHEGTCELRRGGMVFSENAGSFGGGTMYFRIDNGALVFNDGVTTVTLVRR